MTSLLSQSGFLGIKTQASRGTYANPGAASPNQGVYLYFKGGGMVGNRTLLVPDPEIGASRDIPDAALSAVAWAGQYDFYLRMESLATLLAAALGGGSTDTGASTTGFTHTIIPGTTLPWLSLEEKIGNGFDVFNYTDCKVDSLHLEATAGGYLMGTVNLVGITGTSGNTPTTSGNQRKDTSPLLLGAKLTITYNSVALPAKTFKLDIANNLENNDFRLGSLFLGDITEKRRDIKAEVEIRPADSTYWKQAMYGSTSGTAPTTSTAIKQGLAITLTSYEDIAGANAGNKYSLTINLPNAILAPHPVTPKGDDVLQEALAFQSVLSLGANTINAAVINSYATVA